MSPSTRNPAARGRAGRASGRIFAAENFRPEDTRLPLDLQPRRRRDGNAEARIQSAVVAYVRAVAPELLIFAVPNGGYRAPVEAARMKWTGTVAGIPDLCIIAPGGRVQFMECKTSTGRLSADQCIVHEALTALGSPPAIVRSVDDARLALVAWGVATREAGR